MYLLAIESSCDDTGVAILHEGKICANMVSSQMVHSSYGGVVPELASREHIKNLLPLSEQALKHAGISIDQISAVACTQGPGLLGSLLAGMNFAKSISLSLGVPFIAVNHMEAHVLSHFIEPPYPSFPFLCLTVSGGHTQIVRVDDYFNMSVLGETKDDAVGEAFDKCAKILGLGYPGGAVIDKLAQEGNPHAFKFPIAKTEGLSFSFSGVKTAFLYFVQEKGEAFVQNHLSDICASIQHTLIETLTQKLEIAGITTGIHEIAIAGGVAANSYLRASLNNLKEKHKWNIYIPALVYCTDNAAMVGLAAWLKFIHGKTSDLNVPALARMPIGSIR